MKNEEIKELSNDLQEVGKYATDWLVAETKEMLGKNGRFKSSEHTKSLNEIVAEQLIERGYQKKSRTAAEILDDITDCVENMLDGERYMTKNEVEYLLEYILNKKEEYGVGANDE